jgi:ubiquitin-like-conjugating enzyme ATG3
LDGDHDEVTAKMGNVSLEGTTPGEIPDMDDIPDMEDDIEEEEDAAAAAPKPSKVVDARYEISLIFK